MTTPEETTLYDLLDLANVGGLSRNRSLAGYMRWQIGGAAAIFVEPHSVDQVTRVLEIMKHRPEPLLVIGDGSNLLIDSRGYGGVVMRIGRAMSDIRVEGSSVVCGAGIWVPELALRLSRLGLTGLEHIVGIPGTLGGLIVMNGGSQRKGVGTQVKRVSVIRRNGTRAELSHDDLAFSYRHSALQGTGAIVTEVELELAQGARRDVQQEMVSILASRRRKFPKNLPNCGSTFLSNPDMYAMVGPPGLAIEEAGLKGIAIGGAQISPRHANFIVNRGGATSDEVLALIAHIRLSVFKRTGFLMDCEARYVNVEGVEAPAHVFTDAGKFDRDLLSRIDLSEAVNV